MSQGLGILPVDRKPYALILMDDWCVSVDVTGDKTTPPEREDGCESNS